ncbi:MAG: folylpolyglutamate synthase/dihydrofolate synthase family protein [Syntrophomonas sp.]
MSCNLGIKPGLQIISRLLQLMGNPHSKLKCVHIAGTNGKGSTSLMLANILMNAGYRVGRFNSPHLHSYFERFTINNQEIDGQRFQSYLDQIDGIIRVMKGEGLRHPTEFEILTAIAFKYFKDEQVDIAVLEVGMGGIYDSTNVVIPEVAVITGIDFDHMNFLGHTLEEIAWNKAGIIKENVPVVCGCMEDRAMQVIKKIAREKKAELKTSAEIEIKRTAGPDLNGQTVDIQSNFLNLKQVRFSLLGDYQLKNLATVLVCVETLQQKGYQIKVGDITRALSNLRMPGRLEIIKENPLVIGDVGHNPQAARALAESLHNLLPQRNKILVCGVVDDKDISNTIISWGENTRACIITRPEGYRNQNWLRVKDEWNRNFLNRKVYVKEDIIEAVKTGLALLEADEYMVVTGSFYVLNQARKYLINS